MVERAEIRAFVASHRATLENAQAANSLARCKLDLKDIAVAQFGRLNPDRQLLYEKLLDEELEAFCADMRLASVTVQAQVERRRRPRTGLAAASAIAVFVVGVLMMIVLGEPNPLIGILLPLAVAAGVFVLLRRPPAGPPPKGSTARRGW